MITIAMPQSTAHVLERAGCPLHYWLAGPASAPLVVLIHGMALDHRMFDPQVGALATEYRVLTCDLRGHGRSRPCGPGFSIAMLVDDLLAILDQLGCERAVLVGHSMGSIVGQELTFRRPDRVRALVAFGSTCITLPAPPLLALAVRAAPPLLGLTRLIPYRPMQLLAALRMAERPAVRAQIYSMACQVSPARFRQIMAAIVACRHTEPGYRITCPLLIARGEHDHYGGSARAAAAWVARDQHAQLAVIAGAGHNANQDQPAAFNALLLEFLRAHAPARSDEGGL